MKRRIIEHFLPALSILAIICVIVMMLPEVSLSVSAAGQRQRAVDDGQPQPEADTSESLNEKAGIQSQNTANSNESQSTSDSTQGQSMLSGSHTQGMSDNDVSQGIPDTDQSQAASEAEQSQTTANAESFQNGTDTADETEDGILPADTLDIENDLPMYHIAVRPGFSGLRLVLDDSCTDSASAGDTVSVAVDASNMMGGLCFTGLRVVTEQEEYIDTWYDEGLEQYMFMMPDQDVIIQPSFSWIVLRAADSVGTEHTITNYSEHMYQGLLKVGYFEIDGGTLAWCTQHSLPPPAVGTVLRTAQIWSGDETWLSTMMRRIAWYGYSGPMAEITKSELSLSDSDLWRYTALAFSYAYGGDDNYYGYGQRFVEWLSGLGDRANAPEGLSVYRLTTGSLAVQDLVYWTYEPECPLKLKKVSEAPGLTDNHPCYRLEGAEYGVYTDENCSNIAGTLVTDKNGNTDELMLSPGTYYIKELKASEGFGVSEELVKVTLEDEPVIITVAEPPLFDALGLALTKIDGETGKSQEQGTGTLAGAQFTIKYYTGYYTNKDLPEIPSRTWVIETKYVDSEREGPIYYCSLSDEFKIAGDDLYIDNGRAVLPLGTITIEETKAPQGYTLEGSYFHIPGSEEKITGIYVTNIKMNGSNAYLEGGNSYKAVNYPGRGGVRLQKADADTGECVAQGNASLQGAVYAVISQNEGNIMVNGHSYGKGEEVLRMTTDSEGVAETDSDALPFGSYGLMEVSASEGYLLNNTVQNFLISENGVILTLDSPLPEDVIRGGVKLQKRDSETHGTSAQGGASLEGAVFSIINTSSHKVIVDGAAFEPGSIVAQLTTNAKGIIQTKPDLLPFGTYKIVEESAPEGYLKEESISREFAIIKDGAIVDLTGREESVYNKVVRGGVKIQKRDAENKTKEAQGGATLKGAVFDIINMNEQPVLVGGKLAVMGEIVAQIVTDDYGLAQTPDDLLPYGTYKLVEKSAPAGYLSDKELEQIFEIRKDGEIVDLTDTKHSIYNDVIRGGVKIQKRDIQSGDAIPQGSAILKDAVFELVNMNSHAVIAGGEKHQPGAVICRLTTDEDGTAKTDSNFLPYGQYKLVEVTPPSGYLGDGITEQSFTIRENGKITDLTAEEQSISNQVIRGDFELTKIDSASQNSMSDVQFKITSATTGEAHEFTTDANGFYSSASSWNLHSQNTNKGGAEDGLWFGLDKDGQEVPVDDHMGALPFDTYIIEELRCDANEGRRLYKGTVVISRNGYTVDMGNIENEAVNIPALMTSARCEETGTAWGLTSGNVTIIDTVAYRGLIPGQRYTIKGELINAMTKEPVISEDGSAVSVQKEFECILENGSIDVSYSINSSGLSGMDIVVYETLYMNGEKIAEHKNIEDEGQTIHFPGIKTAVREKDSGSGVTGARENITLIDTVSYTNLEAGKTYTLTGILMDQESEAPALIDGRTVTASTTFIPQNSSGSAEVVFNFDGSSLGGKAIVVFETLARGSIVYGEHKDINDRRQTIEFTDISTRAVDSTTGLHIGFAKESAEITDTVDYKNLVPGKEYRIEGVLMDLQSGEPLLGGGQTWTAKQKFVPDAPEGQVSVNFKVPGEVLSGNAVVVFETIYDRETEVGFHRNIDDIDQTVYYPEISTSASGKAPDSHEILAGEKVTILDKVVYRGLMPGEEYCLTGSLVNGKDGKAICRADGEAIYQNVVFVPENSEGSITVEFSVDGTDLAGMDIVVFESLAMDGIVVAEHKDLEDEEQTVHFPKISTDAVCADTGLKLANPADKVTVTDTVRYENLTVGKEYRLEGILMEQSANSPVEVGGKQITAEAIFIPEKNDGTITVDFIFSATELAGKKVVVFETLFHGEDVVAEHKNIEDEGQMIHFPSIKTTARDSRTSEHSGWAACGEDMTVVDEVRYNHLIPGKEYRIVGTVMDKDKEKPLLLGEEKITAEKVFTANAADGCVTLEFNIPGEKLAGKTVVVFETLYYGNTELVTHEDIEDENQTIFYPDIELKTEAKDQETGGHTGEAKEKVTIIDTVTYTGLIPDKKYRLEGTVMDKSTGEVFLNDGHPVTSELEFTPKEADGEVELRFTLDGKSLGDKELVIFEKLYSGDIPVADHMDIDDESQTVRLVPPGSPKLTAPQTGLASPAVYASCSLGIMLIAGGIYLLARKKYTNK